MHPMRPLSIVLGLIAVGARLSASDGVPITVANYTDLPVYAHAVALDPEPICTRLGLAPDTPIAVTDANSRQPLPTVRSMRDGKPVLLVHCALKPRSRLDLVARGMAAGAMPPAPVAATAVPGQAAGELRNGVVRWSLNKDGWILGFDAPPGAITAPMRDPRAEAPATAKRKGGTGVEPLSMIFRGGLEFWVDAENRGRIANAKPSDLGLVPFPATASLVSCTAAIDDGTPTLTLERRLSGFAQGVTVSERFALPTGQPYLTCRIRWTNGGDKPLWIAYVGSGDGIKGSWAPDLMENPLIQRMKTPLKGYLDGAETRPSWLGGLCKVSMECPATGCGVGLSTLLPTPGKVGQGSMIWGVGRHGFQLNLIDPEVGQFPFPLKPRSHRDNGAAFLLTQTGVSTYRASVALWEALAAERAPRLPSPCAVFADGQPPVPQTVATTGDLRPLLHAADGHLVAALRMDFNRQFTCSGTTTVTGTPVEVVFTPLDPKSRVKESVCARIATSGPFTIDLNAAAGATDEIPFLLTFRHGAKAIGTVAIAETMTTAPEPWSPLDGARFTDIATMFRWKAIPLTTDYELQWSRSGDFAAPIAITFAMTADQPWYIPPAAKLPEPGRWFWRIRGLKGAIAGPWSPVRHFTVDRTYGLKPLVRPVSPAQPLFTLEASRWVPYTSFVSDMPADLRPHVGIIVEGFVDKGLPIDRALEGVAAIPHPFLLRTHPPTQITLADIEWVCQTFPNFVGIQGGETIKKVYEPVKGDTGDGDYHRRMVRILAKYGRFYHEADGTYKDDAWQELWDQQGAFLKEYGRHIIFTQKNNIIRRQFYTQSAVMGLWLGGITLGHGAWEDGGFYWQNAGFDGLGVCKGERSGALRTMPRIWWTLMCVQGLARGCSIYSLDGQTLMYGIKEASRMPNGPWRSALWDDQYRTTDTFKRFVVPVIRAAVERRLAPDREVLLKDLRLAVWNDRTAKGDAVAWSHYLEYGPLYAGTYGFRSMGNIHGQLWELFPNTGRYGFIPVLPQGDIPLAPHIRNLPLSACQDEAVVRRTFDAAHPAWYEGDAFASRCGDVLTVMNSHENTDQAQGFRIPLTASPVTTLAGKVQVHAYMLAKVEGQRLWLQANSEHADRPTTLALTCSRKPAWELSPADAGTATWDEAGKVLDLQLDHRAGAVEVTIR